MCVFLKKDLTVSSNQNYEEKNTLLKKDRCRLRNDNNYLFS